MARTETHLKVLVSSPGDVKEERAICEDVVRELNITWSESQGIHLDLIGWETHATPGVGPYPQAVVNEGLGGDYDIFVGIMWTRYGTPTPTAGSGTEEEFELAYARYKDNPNLLRIMFYFRESSPALLNELNLEQLAKVREFRDRLGANGLLRQSYTDVSEFERLLRMHLSRQIQSWKEGSWGTNRLDIVPVAEVHISESNQSDDDAEDDTEGFFDLIECAEESFVALNEVAGDITNAIQELGGKINNRTLDLNNANKQGVVDIKLAKRICSHVAQDMEQFATRMKAEIPIFGQYYRKGVDAVARAATIWTEFGHQDKQSIVNTLISLKGLKASLSYAQTSMTGFRSSIAGVPRITTDIKRAKRITLSVLDSLVDEMNIALNLTSEVERVLEQIIGEGEGYDDNDAA